MKIPWRVLRAGVAPACAFAISMSPGRGQVDAAAAVGRIHGFAETASGAVGVGPDYKLVLGDGGVEFVPALGARAPQAARLRLRLESIRRGGRELPVRRRVKPRVGPRIAVFDRGAGIEERFTTRPDGVELSYRFERPLPGAGDLVVRLRADSGLPRGVDGDELTLADPCHGGVRIGGVTGIDGADRRTAGQSRWVGDALELSLPAEFVDRASWPLVLDPLIGADFRVTFPAEANSEPDVSYDVTHDVYLVVWERDYSATDIAVHAQRLGGDGNPVGGPIIVHDPSTGLAGKPTVANVNLTDRFLVAWEEGPSLFGPWTVRGSCVDAATGAVSSDVSISSGGINTDPDAGGESTLVDDEVIVVWRKFPGQGKWIYGAAVACPASGPPVPAGEQALLGNDLDEPAITKHGGVAGRYLIGATHPGFAIEAVLIDRDLNVLDTIAPAPAGLINPVAHVDVDGDGDDFVAVWDYAEGGVTGADRDIVCRGFTWDAVQGLQYTTPITAIASGVGVDESRPAVAMLGPKTAIAWSREISLQPPASAEIVVRMYGKSCQVCGLEADIGSSTQPWYDSGPVLASRRASGDPGDRGFLAFESTNLRPPFAGEIHGQLLEAVGAGGSVVENTPPCGSGGTIGHTAPIALASAYAYTLNGADPAAGVALLNLAAPGAARLPCGPCLIVAPLIQVPAVVTGGNASVASSAPCAMSLVGGVVQLQWWVVGAAGGCSIGSIQLAFSNIVDVTVGL